MSNRKSAPQTNKPKAIKMEQPLKHQFQNGIPLYSFSNDSYNAMRLDLIFNAGSAFQQKLLVASSANKMLQEGTVKLTGNRLAAKLDYHGAYIDLSIDKDTAWLTLYCLRRNFIYLLPLIKSMLVNPRFAPNDFKLLNTKQKNAFTVNNQKPKYVARKFFNKMLFGEKTPYGQTAELSDFDLLMNDDLKLFHQQFYHHLNCTLIVSGPVDDRLILKIEQTFNDAWGGCGIEPDFEQPIDFKPSHIHSAINDSLQSAIFIGKPMINRDHPDFAKIMVVNTILGGYFGSRLMTNIREDKGYTYGIYSQIVAHRKAAYLQISTEAGVDVTKATIQEIINELNRMRHELVPEKELKLVKNYLYGQFLRSLDGPYALAERFKSILWHDEGMEYYYNTLKTMQDVSAEEILSLAQTYLNPESMLTVVAGAENY